MSQALVPLVTLDELFVSLCGFWQELRCLALSQHQFQLNSSCHFRLHSEVRNTLDVFKEKLARDQILQLRTEYRTAPDRCQRASLRVAHSDVTDSLSLGASSMRDMACFCLILSFLWEQMVKAYKYMSGIFLVTHPSNRPASDCSGQPTKMDVSLLEEQYGCLKQKQRLQTHIIVFKTGERETVPEGPMVSTVLVNKKMKKAKAFHERMPVREVSLGLPSSGNVQESSPWRIHLGLHRLVEGEPRKAPWEAVQNKDEQICANSETPSQEESTTSSEEFLTGSEPSIESVSKPRNSNPAEKTGNSIPGECTNPPLTSMTSPVWTEISTSKLAPAASTKLTYYPFPQKKTPRISEAARRLGLYVSP